MNIPIEKIIKDYITTKEKVDKGQQIDEPPGLYYTRKATLAKIINALEFYIGKDWEVKIKDLL